MNARLQFLIDNLQRSTQITEAEKISLLKALEEDEKNNIQLQKKLDEVEEGLQAKNRELEIEAALERVRSRAMTMHDSTELSSVALTLYEELQKLDFQFGAATVVIMNDETGDVEHWVAGFSQKKYSECYQIKYFNHPCHNAQLSSWRRNEKTLVYHLTGEERVSYTNYIFEHTAYKTFPEREKEWMRTTDPVFTLAYMKSGALMWAPNAVTEDQKNTLQRFAKVFEQAYTRFLDLQKAESQARESQIQLVLEKIRARTMAMQKSDELTEVAGLLFAQLATLGVRTWTSGFNVWSEDNNSYVDYITSPNGGFVEPYRIHATMTPVLTEISDARKRGSEFLVQYVEGERLKETYLALAKCADQRQYEKMLEDGFQFPTHQYDHFVFGAKVSLMFITYEPVPEAHDIFKRLGNVFEQTYTRFLDLQKAEAQAREAQIEAALEKIRSRSLAMHQSEELKEVIAVLFEKLSDLKVLLGTVAIQLFDQKSLCCDFWVGNSIQEPQLVYLPHDPKAILADTFLKDSWYAMNEGQDIINKKYTRAQKDNFFEYVFANNNFTQIPESAREVLRQMHGHIICLITEKNSALFADSWDDQLFSEESLYVIKRAAKVFEQAYIRFLDLQKAEAQAREAQIETALERIRATALAMHLSTDLINVANVLREQMGGLGQPDLESAIVHLYNGDSATFEAWYAYRPPNLLSGEVITGVAHAPKYSSEWGREVISNYSSPKTEYTVVASGQKISEWYKVLETVAPAVVEYDAHGELRVPEILYYHFSKFSGGALLMISNHEPSTEARELQKRAAAVFDLAYTRFNDLKQAEAQAREAQIETALERVRSRSMAMHKSEELLAVITVVSEQLEHLKYKFNTVSFALNNQEHDYSFWFAVMGNPTPSYIQVPYLKNPMFDRVKEVLGQDATLYSDTLTPDESRQWHEHVFAHVDLPFLTAETKEYILSSGYARSVAITPSIMLVISNYAARSYSEDENAILKRFAVVFEQSYTRFLDLKNAEAQAREAKIEASLERIRSNAMAMRTSDEITALIGKVFTECTKLDIQLNRAIIMIYDPASLDSRWWMANPEALDVPVSYLVRYHDYIPYQACLKAWKNRDLKWIYTLQGSEKSDWDNFIFINTELVLLPSIVKDGMMGLEKVYLNASFNNFGCLTLASVEPMTEDHFDVLLRIAKVFDLTYTRFNDLKQAEAQAREAKIEASLERVRGKAMAMHSSKDLAATIGIFYRELESFSITPRRCGVGLIEKESRMAELSTMNTTVQGDSIEVVGKIILQNHHVLEAVFENWLQQLEYHPVLRGKEIKEYYQLLRPQISFPEYPNDAVQFGYFFFFPEGGVYAWTDKEMTEDELKIYRRFTSVLSLTYKRYKDIKDAELRTQLAVRESAIDRVRAGIASMRTAEDLQRITPLVWHELTTLNVPFFRCGVYIINEEDDKIHMYMSTPEGKPLAAIHLSFNSLEINKTLVAHWRSQNTYTEHWDRKQFAAFTKSLLDLGQIQTASTYQGGVEPPESITLQFIPFAQGMLYVGSAEPLVEAQIELVHALAEAFSVAYARYEDFTKLEYAKQQIEKTLVDLRQTQAQLVQSEKMASLGELTAGIAHEIQNPLNFVNNFSELSTELLDEMIAELKENNSADAIAIADSVRQNLDKILHHGKRADGIVKGMLQHSRSSNGQKQETNINALADEYLRLAYHGLRAKDKAFNATIKTKFDENVGKVNVIAQDLGRVILNLINNAFYAVAERKKQLSQGYEPTVEVSTLKTADKIQILIKDNGSGIPQRVLDKIFQPFFTTKPTGQGTGLGLSLSYDIVKAHGGELTVETKEHEGSLFMIILPSNK